MASPSPIPEISANPVFLLVAPYSEDYCSFQLFFYANLEDAAFTLVMEWKP